MQQKVGIHNFIDFKTKSILTGMVYKSKLMDLFKEIRRRKKLKKFIKQVNKASFGAKIGILDKHSKQC